VTPQEGDRLTVPGRILDTQASEHFVLRVVGDMATEAGILDGDFIILRRCSVAVDGEMVVAVVGDDALIRWLFHEGEAVRLESFSGVLPPIRLPLADLHLRGAVVGLIRRIGRKGAA